MVHIMIHNKKQNLLPISHNTTITLRNSVQFIPLQMHPLVHWLDPLQAGRVLPRCVLSACLALWHQKTLNIQFNLSLNTTNAIMRFCLTGLDFAATSSVGRFSKSEEYYKHLQRRQPCSGSAKTATLVNASLPTY